MSRTKLLVGSSVVGWVVPFALLLAGCGASDQTDREQGSGGSGNAGNGSGGSGNVGNGSSTGGSGNVGGGAGGSGGGAGGSGNVGGGTGGGTGGGNVGGTGNTGAGGTAGVGGSGGDPNVLPPPPAGKGLQISTPEFVLRPGQEVFKCYHVEVPSDVEVNVSRFASKMAPGSHHFILYQSDTAGAPSGTLADRGCSSGADARWVYASSSVDNSLTMPQGVAMPFSARQPVQFDMHYINTGSSDLRAKVTLNLEFVQGAFERAGALVSFNTGIAVQPRSTQTVSGTCAIPAGAKFFLMSTHTHKFATLAQVRRNSATGEELVRTEDWEHPSVGQWAPPNFLTFAAGERIYYSCSYNNTTNAVVRVGTSAATDEMCMAIGYYFPAANVGRCSGF